MNGTNSSQPHSKDHGLDIFIKQDFLYILGSVIVFINLLVFVTLVKRSVFHDYVKQLYLTNLSIADMLVGCVIIMRAVLNTCADYIADEPFIILCFTRLLLTLLSLGSSALVLTALTTYVYIRVSRPMSIVSRAITASISRHKIFLAIIWTICALNGALSYFYSNFRRLHCKLDCVTRYVFPHESVAIFNLLVVLFPSVCIAICQIHLLVIVHRNLWSTYRRTIPLDVAPTWHELRTAEHQNVKKQFRNAITICLISSSYILCALPFNIAQVLLMFRSVSNTTMDILGLIWYLNSLLNPIIYSWRLPVFRQNMRYVFCCVMFTDEQLSTVTLH